MDNYKITAQNQLNALLDTMVRVYAQEIVNTDLLTRLVSKGDSVVFSELNEEVTHNLQTINSQIREKIYIDFGYLDPDAF